jgi:hypothetical protein
MAGMFQPVIDTSASVRTTPTGVEAPSSGGAIAQGVAQAASDISNFFIRKHQIDTKREVAEQEAIELSQSNEALAQFTNQMLSLGDMARTTKGANTTKLRSKASQDLQAFIKNNPALREEALKIFGKVTSTAGMGKALGEGTAEEKQQATLESDAAKSGFITSSMSEEERDQGLRNYQRIQQSNATLDNLAKERAKIKDEDDAAKRALERKSKLALTEFFRASTQSMSQKIDRILIDVNAGTLSSEEAELRLNELQESVGSMASQIGAHAGSDFIGVQTSAFNKMMTNARGVLQGTMSSQRAINLNNLEKNKNELEMMEDPELAQFVTLSRLLGHQNSVLMQSTGNAIVTRKIQEIEDKDKPEPNPFAEPEVSKEAYSVVLENIKEFSGGVRDFNEQDIEALDTSLNRILEGVNIYQLAAKSPKDFKAVVSFLGSPQVGKYIEQSGGMLPENYRAASEAIKAGYMDDVGQLIREEYLNGRSTIQKLIGGDVLPTVDLFDVNTSGGQISFHLNPEIAKGLSISQRGRLTQKASDLNRKLSPIVNEMVRVGAHLEGGTNYSQFLEDNLSSVFSLDQEQEQATKQATKQPTGAPESDSKPRSPESGAEVLPKGQEAAKELSEAELDAQEIRAFRKALSEAKDATAKSEVHAAFEDGAFRPAV